MGVEFLYKTKGKSHFLYYQSRYQTQNPVIKYKIGLLNLAKELSNTPKACKIMSVSHNLFCRYRELADETEVDSLIKRSRRIPNLKNRTDDATEYTVVNYAIDFLTYE